MASFHVGGIQMKLMEIASLQNKAISLQNKNRNINEQLELLNKALKMKLEIFKGNKNQLVRRRRKKKREY